MTNAGATNAVASSSYAIAKQRHKIEQQKKGEQMVAFSEDEMAKKPGGIPVPGLCETDKIAFDYRQMATKIAIDTDDEGDDDLEATIAEILDEYDEWLVNVIVKWPDGSYSFHPHTENTIHGIFWAVDSGVAFPIGAEVKIGLMPDMHKEAANDHGIFFDTDMAKEGFIESIAFFAGDVPE